ncbi:sensor histidine kinase [Arenibaculum pallidiluteum]|uniref:sensor histidine kinase n=1 Tax=Arenibaculum pallidiluteum TaxID=2812559 RepID=UPI001A972CCF|nr:histidine kinase dimerization/phosphoacceptor domain -containing protein [Arenibaculum pallidiluteum]
MASIQILHLEDDPNDAELAAERLRSDGLDCVIFRVDTEPAFHDALSQGPMPDLILSDFSLPSFDGLSALRIARSKAPYTPFVLLSGAIGEERATELLREGATDYVLKDRLSRLSRAVARALTEARERAERDWAMAALKRALADKEALFAEVHHRVRNNFQIVSSLLRLHESRVADPAGAALLRDLQARVRSMALVHDILYRTEEAATLDFTGYARQLCTELEAQYRDGTGTSRLSVLGQPVLLTLTQAVPAGLLLHELVADAMAQSPAGPQTAITVHLVPADGNLVVEIGGAEPLSERRDDPLGMKLIHRLAHQLGGGVQLVGDPGRWAVLTFPIRPPVPGEEFSALARRLAPGRS